MTTTRWQKVQAVLALGLVLITGVALWSKGVPGGLPLAQAVVSLTLALAFWLNLRYGVLRYRRVALIGAALGTLAAGAALRRRRGVQQGPRPEERKRVRGERRAVSLK